MNSFRDLRAWKESVTFVESVYRVTTDFPSDEKFGLCAQLRRCAVSIPSNIAEGQGRMSPGEWLQFLGHARGSLYEIQTQIILARRLGYISEESEGQLMHGAAGVGQTLAGLIKYVQRKKEQNEQHNA